MKEIIREIKIVMPLEGVSFPPSTISRYAREAIKHYLETGQVAPANLVIEAALKSKRVNADRLVKWMKHAIPHKFDENTKKFGGKDKNKARRVRAKEFVDKNPHFYRWRPTDTNKSDDGRKAHRNIHIQALKSSSSEILKCSYDDLNSSEVETIEKVISELNSMINGIRIVRGKTARNNIKAHFVSGGLPSLGKKRK